GRYLLLDVRQPEEYRSGHLPGATLIPLNQVEARHAELDRGQTIITYCRSGRRSMAAAIALCGLGFQNVQTMNGGIANWAYETVAGIPEAQPQLIAEAATASDVLMLAIRMEKGAGDFYRAAAQRADDPAARDMFSTLAEVEDGHMSRLHQRAVALLGEAAVPSLSQLKADASMDYMEGGIEINPALTRIDEQSTGELEALEIAVEKEYMSYDFYKRASALLVDTDARALLNELALDERGHASVLLTRLGNIVREE
ncbi:MAG: rhodanese-like domain-containing protein, partial [Chloroflexota bacterium]|nr:rhodanese-like domain-containing protein [Chloroflexota bacterium]